MPRQRELIPESEQFTEQLNIRFKPSTARWIPKLRRLDGETIQELFDRLVLEEALREPAVLLGQYTTERARIDHDEAEFRRDIAESQVKTAE